MPISGEGGSLEARQQTFAPDRLCPLSTIPIPSGDGPERDLVRKAGIDISHDSMEVELTASTGVI